MKPPTCIARRSIFQLFILVAGAFWSTASRAADPPKAAVSELPLGSVKPSGWLKAQLRIQADGLGGHIDEFWPDIKESAWIGGKREGWERAPYWLDGIVPLAYLLDDPTLKLKARRYIDYILEHQTADGWFGPVGDNDPSHKPYDVWPLFPLLKALTQYQEATGDPRVIPALLRCARKIDEVVSKEPLYSWAHYRAADLVVTLGWLHARTGDPMLPPLAEKILKQGYDWRHHFEHFDRFREKANGYYELDNHGVNTGMGLKFGVERYLTTGNPRDRDSIFAMIETLDRYHGQVNGAFTCDEHLAGKSPSQGTELCTVAEMMYSVELGQAITGDPRLGDRLERLAFNALPATFKKDMTAHQYDQQANQVVCKISEPRVYTDNGPEANLYGLEPFFGCCAANMHQGWPKFATHLWGKDNQDGGLMALAYAPSVVEVEVGGKPVRVELKTDYPFRDRLTFTIKAPGPVTLPMHFRVPGWAGRLDFQTRGDLDVTMGNARGHQVASSTTFDPPRPRMISATFEGQGEQTVELTFAMAPRLVEGFNQAVAVERGPLLYSLKIDTEWARLRGKEPYADYEVFAESPWNYALMVDGEHPEKSLIFDEKPVGDRPFSPEGAPVVARAIGIRLPKWGLEKNAAAPPPRVGPEDLKGGMPELITLIPYGCTDLRVTEFPAVRHLP